MSNDTHRRAFRRAHDDLFSGDTYNAEFFNYSGGTWDPDADEITGESRSSIGTKQVEIVPPAMDTTVDVDGTSFSWDTSIRLESDTSLVANFKPLGDDSDRPTEVEVDEGIENGTTKYQLHGYKEERGSGMVMCRLVEA